MIERTSPMAAGIRFAVMALDARTRGDAAIIGRNYQAI
jgi:hypothetical protein